MTLMLHAGANPVEYDALRAFETPAATSTHMPIPHFRVVDLIAHSLGYYGHQVVEQHFGITLDGMRFFGVLSLKSDYTGYSATATWSVSEISMIGNFRWAFRSARGRSCATTLPSPAITLSSASTPPTSSATFPVSSGEIIEPLAIQREQQHRQLEHYRATPLSDDRAD